MDSVPKRPWYRLHWLTWLLVLVVVFMLVLRQRTEYLSYTAVGASQLWKSATFGWPLIDLDLKETVNLGVAGPRQAQYAWRPIPLAVNISFCLLLVAGTGIAFERFIRAVPRMQFSIRSLLILLSVVAVFLALISNEFLRVPGAEPSHEHRALMYWAELRNPLSWPLALALGCTIYSLGWLACFAALRVWSLVRRART